MIANSWFSLYFCGEIYDDDVPVFVPTRLSSPSSILRRLETLLDHLESELALIIPPSAEVCCHSETPGIVSRH